MAALERPMTTTGFCGHPSPGSHKFCQERGFTCTCECHQHPELYEDGHTIGSRPEAASSTGGAT